MIADGSLSFETVSFDSKPWYEIDTIEDLENAEILFSFENSSTAKSITFLQDNLLNMPQIKVLASS